jgi:phospholipid/cholesterol/gamma-HCH transport system ATP-binding protein
MSSEPDNLIEVCDLKFAYGENRVLNGISLTVPRGKLVAILGASGCGKTTLLRIIGGQMRPQAGCVRVEGQVVHELDDDALYRLRRKMGMMFQKSGLFTDLSTFENVAFPMRELTDLPEPVIRDLVLMKLHAVGLRSANGLMPSELSGGMTRRVALARAIALDPTLIMYDEPFAGLDPISMGVAANLIRTLNDTTGATSLIVSHDVQECFAICDYAYLLSSQGQVVAHGQPKELNASEHPEVRQFIRGEPDGPVRFHYPARPLAEELGVQA